MIRIQLIRIAFIIALLLGGVAEAQNNKQCISRIQKRLDVVGTADFNFHQARQIIREFEFGKARDFVNDGGKRAAFQRVFTSMSEFLALAPNDLSGKALKGYTKFTGCLIRSSDDALSDLNIGHLKEAFTRGSFKGKSFDDVMRQLADETKFDFDPGSRTFSSKRSGLKYGDGPKANGSYNQGERHAVSHICRGHLANDFSVPAGKSLFAQAEEIFDLVDDLWASPNKKKFGNNGWTLDFAPRIIGTNGQTVLRIHVDGDKIRSAFPTQ